MILQGKSDAGKLLKIFALSIMEWVNEAETTSEADENNDDDTVINIEAEDTKLAKPGKVKQATAKMLITITDDCDDVLALLLALAVKYPQVIAAPLSHCADKRARLVPKMDRL